jgi:hypothetical protein
MLPQPLGIPADKSYSGCCCLVVDAPQRKVRVWDSSCVDLADFAEESSDLVGVMLFVTLFY